MGNGLPYEHVQKKGGSIQQNFEKINSDGSFCGIMFFLFDYMCIIWAVFLNFTENYTKLTYCSRIDDIQIQKLKGRIEVLGSSPGEWEHSEAGGYVRWAGFICAKAACWKSNGKVMGGICADLPGPTKMRYVFLCSHINTRKTHALHQTGLDGEVCRQQILGKSALRWNGGHVGAGSPDLPKRRHLCSMPKLQGGAQPGVFV